MAKIRKNYRIDSEIVEMIETLIPFLSAEKNIKLTETSLLELLISERYQKLLSDLEK